jgi:glutamyl/glutaminyl-tRNA synthetase
VALFNALFAVTQHGRFVLRFDDTDFARSTAAFAREIEIDLGWLGLEPDLVVRQSERGALYDTAAAQLKEQGRLYPCFETAEELEKRRKLQIVPRSSLPRRNARASRRKAAARIGVFCCSTRPPPGETSSAARRISTAPRFPIRC